MIMPKTVCEEYPREYERLESLGLNAINPLKPKIYDSKKSRQESFEALICMVMEHMRDSQGLRICPDWTNELVNIYNQAEEANDA